MESELAQSVLSYVQHNASMHSRGSTAQKSIICNMSDFTGTHNPHNAQRRTIILAQTSQGAQRMLGLA